ncbi:hypothetical protein M426DRAFT_169137 [Hypoxylon sp. CI-4A]|nr:hypothetical protein M426DRAFT_169137 [Hypoxylon sp. CI-4A]
MEHVDDELDLQVPFLDVFILTFNAGKNQINAPIFARHLYDAFLKNASTLPELVVISLQEMAPLAQAFIGSYMVNPYFQRYESAVNIAAAKVAAQEGCRGRRRESPYTLVGARNVGMTGIMLFARDPDGVKSLESTEVGFGAGDMANKGAVAFRIIYEKQKTDLSFASTELTFVATHLAALEWNLEKRNKNWENIVSGLVFKDPKKFAGNPSTKPTPQAHDDSDIQESLLGTDSTRKDLRDISVYKPGAHLFVAGDLNYRLSKRSPALDSVFPDMNPESPNYFTNFLHRDQLTNEKNMGNTLHGLKEAPIKFPPTYKLAFSSKAKLQSEPCLAGDEDNDMDIVQWSWAPHRWPGWCDRVLYLDTPSWARTLFGSEQVRVTAYDAMAAVRSSDHRAVFLRAEVPMLSPEKMEPPESVRREQLSPKWKQPISPRIMLPYPIDFQAWDHRAQVKKWESMIGWSMLVSQSKQGIMVFVTMFLIGLGAWWYRSR